MFHPHPSGAGRGFLLVLTTAVAFSGVGCTATRHYLHHHAPAAVGEKHRADYFHCGHCGRVVPKSQKKHVCDEGPTMLPFYGFQPTCWHRWPAGWVGCPEPPEEAEITWLENNGTSDEETHSDGSQRVDERTPVVRRIPLP